MPSKKIHAADVANVEGDFESVNLHNSGVRETTGKNGKTIAVEKVKPAETWGEMLRAWPLTTLFIVSNEFCERFSYYGMRTVLTLYFVSALQFSDDVSTILFNGFTVLCYFSPLLGSILADGYIGKFMTILIISVLYLCGQIGLAASSAIAMDSFLHPYVDLLGLFIIGLGTGGIKPCVSSFGGDQFDQYQVRMISIFFSVFYFSINAGSMISTFITPIFRSQSCLGQSSCYPLAFGVPAALMLLAVVLFALGSPWYRKKPPKENIFGEVFRVGKKALQNRSGNAVKVQEHWLDYYFDDHFCENDVKCLELRHEIGSASTCHERKLVADIKTLLRLLVMFLPLPMFWALYDQQGSRWMIQSLSMDTHLWDDVTLLPDQMQTLNAALILIFIPLFQAVIYPLWECFAKVTPLRKMVGGGLLASLAFVVSSFVQFQVNNDLAVSPQSGNSFVNILNTIPQCDVNFVVDDDLSRMVTSGAFVRLEAAAGNRTLELKYNGTGCDVTVLPPSINQLLESGQSYRVVVTEFGVYARNLITQKPKTGKGEFQMSVDIVLPDSMEVKKEHVLALCRKLKNVSDCDPTPQSENTQLLKLEYVPYQTSQDERGGAFTVEPRPTVSGEWNVFLAGAKDPSKEISNENLIVHKRFSSVNIERQGGVYLAVYTGSFDDNEPTQTVVNVSPDNTVSILWQIPQIMILTVAEILFSISGLEFAYSQAAPSMKSLVQAFFLLTTAMGNVIIVVITLVKIPNMAYELIFYAALMLVVIFIFALMAIFYYEYREVDSGEEEEESTYTTDKSQLAVANNWAVGKGAPESNVIVQRHNREGSDMDLKSTFKPQLSGGLKSPSMDTEEEWQHRI